MRTYLSVLLLSYSSFLFANPFAYIPDCSIGLLVFDTSSNSLVNRIKLSKCPNAVAVNQAKHKAYAVNQWDGSISVIDTSNNTIISSVPDVWGTGSIAVNQKNAEIYVGKDGFISVINGYSNVVSAIIGLSHSNTSVNGITFNPSGTKAYITTGGEGSIYVIDVASKSVISKISTMQPSNVLTSSIIDQGNIVTSLSGDIIYVTTSNYNNYLIVIDAVNNKIISSLSGEFMPADSIVTANPGIAINQSGSRLYVTHYEGIAVIDTSNNKVLYNIETHRGSYTLYGGFPSSISNNLAISDNGNIYAASDNGLIAIDTKSNLVISVAQDSQSYNKFYNIAIQSDVSPVVNKIGCLFDWAQSNYANLFYPSVSGLATFQEYTYRYYSGGNIYLGVAVSKIDGNEHTYYMSATDGVIHDAGTFLYWQGVSDCQ
jgi:YVTN family beta-propeller protein